MLNPTGFSCLERATISVISRLMFLSNTERVITSFAVRGPMNYYDSGNQEKSWGMGPGVQCPLVICFYFFLPHLVSDNWISFPNPFWWSMEPVLFKASSTYWEREVDCVLQEGVLFIFKLNFKNPGRHLWFYDLLIIWGEVMKTWTAFQHIKSVPSLRQVQMTSSI